MLWNQYKAVLWDFDGVILDTEWPIYETWRDIYAKEGQKLTLETYVQCIGSDFDTWSPETHLEKLTGKDFNWDEISLVRNKEIRRRVSELDINPGIREAWDAIQTAGLKLAVVSSSSHSWVDRWLKKHGLYKRLDVVICRGDAPRIKPAPDLYLKAAEILNLLSEDCLVIEDSLNGLKAATSAGCDSVIVPNRITKVCDFSSAKYTLENFDQLLDSSLTKS